MNRAQPPVLLTLCLLTSGCMEVPDPDGAGAFGDGGRPLLLRLPAQPGLSVQGGCAGDAGILYGGHGAPGGPGGLDVRDGSAAGDAAVGAGSPDGAPMPGESQWPAPSAAGQLLISEFMADPAALSDSDGEWFELHNPGDTPLELTGCEISDGQSAGAPIAEPLVVGPGAAAAIARRPSPGFSPDAIVAFALKNSGDTLVLRCNGIEIDRLDYGPGFPIVAGASTQLDPQAMRDGGARANDDGGNWCLADTAYASDLGTPGEPNRPCWPAQGGEVDAGAP